MDANLDPELALALRVSLEEERARQQTAGGVLLLPAPWWKNFIKFCMKPRPGYFRICLRRSAPASRPLAVRCLPGNDQPASNSQTVQEASPVAPSESLEEECAR